MEDSFVFGKKRLPSAAASSASLSRSLTFASPSAGKKRSGNPVVLYFTSLRGVRKTHSDCAAVRSILRGHRVAADERDVSMDAELRRELQLLLTVRGRPFSLPQLLIGGRLVGGADEVRQLHESGELRRLLDGAARIDPASPTCGACGGVRFLPCDYCGGGRKVFIDGEDWPRRCVECNENGLIRCPHCCQ